MKKIIWQGFLMYLIFQCVNLKEYLNDPILFQECGFCQYCNGDILKSSCLACIEGFQLNETTNLCVSLCQSQGKYLSLSGPSKGLCISSCSPFSEEQDENHSVCYANRECSIGMVMGNEHPQEFQEHFVVLPELDLMITANFDSLNLFETSMNVKLLTMPQPLGILSLRVVQEEKRVYVLHQNYSLSVYSIPEMELVQFYQKTVQGQLHENSVLLAAQKLVVVFNQDITTNLVIFNFETQEQVFNKYYQTDEQENLNVNTKKKQNFQETYSINNHTEFKISSNSKLVKFGVSNPGDTSSFLHFYALEMRKNKKNKIEFLLNLFNRSNSSSSLLNSSSPVLQFEVLDASYPLLVLLLYQKCLYGYTFNSIQIIDKLQFCKEQGGFTRVIVSSDEKLILLEDSSQQSSKEQLTMHILSEKLIALTEIRFQESIQISLLQLLGENNQIRYLSILETNGALSLLNLSAIIKLNATIIQSSSFSSMKGISNVRNPRFIIQSNRHNSRFQRFYIIGLDIMEEWILTDKKLKIKSLLSRDNNFEIFAKRQENTILSATITTDLVQTQIDNNIILYDQNNHRFITNGFPSVHLIQFKNHYSRVFPLDLQNSTDIPQITVQNKNNNDDSQFKGAQNVVTITSLASLKNGKITLMLLSDQSVVFLQGLSVRRIVKIQRDFNRMVKFNDEMLIFYSSNQAAVYAVDSQRLSFTLVIQIPHIFEQNIKSIFRLSKESSKSNTLFVVTDRSVGEFNYVKNKMLITIVLDILEDGIEGKIQLSKEHEQQKMIIFKSITNILTDETETKLIIQLGDQILELYTRDFKFNQELILTNQKIHFLTFIKDIIVILSNFMIDLIKKTTERYNDKQILVGIVSNDNSKTNSTEYTSCYGIHQIELQKCWNQIILWRIDNNTFQEILNHKIKLADKWFYIQELNNFYSIERCFPVNEKNKDCWYINEYRQLYDIRPIIPSSQENILEDLQLSSSELSQFVLVQSWRFKGEVINNISFSNETNHLIIDNNASGLSVLKVLNEKQSYYLKRINQNHCQIVQFIEKEGLLQLKCEGNTISFWNIDSEKQFGLEYQLKEHESIINIGQQKLNLFRLSKNYTELSKCCSSSSSNLELYYQYFTLMPKKLTLKTQIHQILSLSHLEVFIVISNQGNSIATCDFDLDCQDIILPSFQQPILNIKESDSSLIYFSSKTQISSYLVTNQDNEKSKKIQLTLLRTFSLPIQISPPSINDFYIDSTFNRLIVITDTYLLSFNIRNGKYEKTIEEFSKQINLNSFIPIPKMIIQDTILIIYSRNLLSVYKRNSLEIIFSCVFEDITQVAVLESLKILFILSKETDSKLGTIFSAKYESIENDKPSEVTFSSGMSRINLKSIGSIRIFDEEKIVFGFEETSNCTFWWDVSYNNRHLFEEKVIACFDCKITDMVIIKKDNQLIISTECGVYAVGLEYLQQRKIETWSEHAIKKWNQQVYSYPQKYQINPPIAFYFDNEVFIFQDALRNYITRVENNKLTVVTTSLRRLQQFLLYYTERNQQLIVSFDQSKIIIFHFDDKELQVLEQRIYKENPDKNRQLGDEYNLEIESCRSIKHVLICHNTYGQLIRYSIDFQEQDIDGQENDGNVKEETENKYSVNVNQTVIHSHHSEYVIEEITLIYPFVITYDNSGKVIVFNIQTNETAFEQIFLKEQIISMQYNVEQRYILIFSRRQILIVILSYSEAEGYFIGDDGNTNNREIEDVFVDVKFNRLFIQKKGEKLAVISSYPVTETSRTDENNQFIILPSKYGNKMMIFLDNYLLFFSSFEIKIIYRETLLEAGRTRISLNSTPISNVQLISSSNLLLILKNDSLEVVRIKKDSTVNPTTLKFQFLEKLSINTPILVNAEIKHKDIDHDLVFDEYLSLIGISNSNVFNYSLSLRNSPRCKFSFASNEQSISINQIYMSDKIMVNDFYDSSQQQQQQVNFLFPVGTLVEQLRIPQTILQSFPNASIFFSPLNQESSVLVNEKLFSHIIQPSMTLMNLQLIILDHIINEIITFPINPKNNQKVKHVKFINISLSRQSTPIQIESDRILTESQNPLQGVQFFLEDLDSLIIRNLTISNSRFNSSVIFNITNSQFIDINVVSLNNLFFENESGFISLMNISIRVGLSQIIAENIQTSFPLFVVKKVESLILQDSILQNIYNSQIENTINPLFRVACVNNFLARKLQFIRIIHLNGIAYINKVTQGRQTYHAQGDQFQMNDISLAHSCALSQSFLVIQSTYIIIIDLNASNNECSVCVGTVISLKNYSYLSISNSTFYNNTGYIAGAIYSLPLLHAVISIFSMSNTIFQNNKVSQYAGAILLESLNFKHLKNITFTSNKSPIGGAIRYFYQKETIPPEFTTEVNFIDNFAFIFAENVGSFPSYILPSIADLITQQYVPLEQIDLFEPSETTQFYRPLPLHLRNLTTSYAYSIKDFRSGAALNLRIQVFDENNHIVQLPFLRDYFGRQLIKEFNEYELHFISLSHALVLDLRQSYQPFNSLSDPIVQFNNSIWINDTLLIGQPMSTESFVLLAPFLRQPHSPYSENHLPIKIIFKIHFRNCKIGEVLERSSELTLKCHPCPQSQYSFDTYENATSFDDLLNNFEIRKCKACPSEAIFCEGSTMTLRDGYWRESNVSDIIIPCSNNPSNCFQANEVFGYCKEGNIGPLCERCDFKGEIWGDKYMSKGDFECSKCFGTYSFATLKHILLYLSIMVYLASSLGYFLSESISNGRIYYLRMMGLVSLGNSSLRQRSSIYVKQMIHYVQMISIISQLGQSNSFSSQSVPAFLGSPIKHMNEVADCFQTFQSIPQVYVRAFISLTIPIFFSLMLWVLVKLVLYMIYRELRIRLLLAVSVYISVFFQPNIVSFLIQLVSCRVIGNRSYIRADITQECTGSSYSLYSLAFVLPSLLIWIFLPAIILIALISRRSRLSAITVQYEFGFLYSEYCSNRFYWEFIKLYLKLFVIVILSQVKDNPELGCALTMGALQIYGYFLIKLKPFQNQQLNRLDFFTIVVLLSCLILGTLQRSNFSEEIKKLAAISQSIVSYSFLGILGYLMGKMKLMEIISCFHRFLSFLHRKFPQFFPCPWLKKESSMRVTMNWIKLKKKVFLSIAMRKNIEQASGIPLAPFIFGDENTVQQVAQAMYQIPKSRIINRNQDKMEKQTVRNRLKGIQVDSQKNQQQQQYTSQYFDILSNSSRRSVRQTQRISCEVFQKSSCFNNSQHLKQVLELSQLGLKMTESKTVEMNSLSSRRSSYSSISSQRDTINQSNNSNYLPEQYLVPSEKQDNYPEQGFQYYSNEYKSISEIQAQCSLSNKRSNKVNDSESNNYRISRQNHAENN